MRVDPLEATVTLEQRIEKDVQVSARLSGYPEVGYELVQHLVNPEVLKVSGPKSRLESLERLESDVIDLTGRKADFSEYVPVRTEEDLIEFSASSVVEVRGIIREVIVEKTYEAVALNYKNLSPDMTLGEIAEFGSVKVSGPQLTVEALRANDLILDVECGTINSPGSYELAVDATVPPGISLISYQPLTVNAQAEPAPAPPAETAIGGEG
jgi:YbbR domain-containing protein